MHVTVTGASGLLGGNLAVELLAQGHHVRATRRAGSKVAHLSRFPIEWVDADLDDVAALTRAFDGAEVVFHCAAQVSIVQSVTPALERANVTGTKNVIAAVRAAKVRRLVHCSTVGAVGLSEDGQPVTEGARWNFPEHGLADGYVTTKRRAEDLVREAVAGGLDAVIANPTYMIGPYDAKLSSGRFVWTIARGKLPGLVPGANNFVDVRDVARGMALAAEKGRAGERYILGGVNLPFTDFVARVARLAGVKPPQWRVPWAGAVALGWLGDLQEAVLRREPLVNSVTVRYGFCKTFIFSSEKAQRELGYRVSPLDDAIAACLAWFREHGLLRQ